MTAIETRYLDHYRLIRRIDTGAMLDTYEAELLGWDDYNRRLALKTLRPRFEREPAVWQRFVEGATRASSLRHPDMLGVHEVGFDGGAHYLAVDLVEGQSLRELLDRCRELGRRFPISAAAYVVRELAKTLHDLHVEQPGTGHGDVSPHNVYIVAEGAVKLGDLGASAVALSLLRSDPAAIKDRLPYYAPELLAGAGPGPKTDVFALGLILFELLTGCPFNSGDSEQDMLRHAANPPQLLPSHVVDGVSALDHIVRGALQRDPAARTPSAEQLGAQLSEYLGRDLFNRVSMVGLVHTLLRAPEQSGARRRSGISGAEGVTPGALGSRTPSGQTPSGQTPSGQTPSLLTRDVTHTHAPAASSPQPPVIPEHLVSPAAPAVDSKPLPVVVDAYTRATQAEPEEVFELDDADLLSEQVFQPGRRLVRGLMWFVGATALTAGVLAALLVWREGSLNRVVDSDPVVAVAGSSAKSLPVASQVPTAASLGVQLAPPDSVPETASSLPVPAVAAQVVEEADHGTESRPAATEAEPEERTESSPPKRVTSPKRMTLEKSMKVKELYQLTRQANRRGLFPGDDPQFDHWRSEARSAVARGDDAAVQHLRQLVEDFVIDRKFVERKLRRLSSAMARVRPGSKREASVNGAWIDIQYLVNQERLVEASREISKLLGRLRRS